MEILQKEWLRAVIPPRAENTHKGSFGRLVILSGSEAYRGAPLLVSEGALRMGVGLVRLVSERAVTDLACTAFPELLLSSVPPFCAWGSEEQNAALALCEGAQAIVVGPGCGVSEGLYDFILALLSREGCAVLLDADALGALARHREEAVLAVRGAKRPVVMTPHPLELGRLLGVSAAEIQAHREHYARSFAEQTGASLLLKGQGTVITDGVRAYENPTGSSALAKGGSGDVLSGAVGALLGQGADPLAALCAGAYLHGRAADALAEELSRYGVTPSDLPKQMARELCALLGGA